MEEKMKLETLKLKIQEAVIGHQAKPQSNPRNRVILDEDKFNAFIFELDKFINQTQKLKDMRFSMRFRGLYFTTGGIDEITKPVLWKWGWRFSQSNTSLFLGFCYLSWIPN